MAIRRRSANAAWLPFPDRQDLGAASPPWIAGYLIADRDAAGYPHRDLGRLDFDCDCSKWAFLDTETTGLAGGSGTYAFLIGVGRITPAGFELRQFFMRDLAEEASLLHGLSEYLAQFDTLVTYNGKTYDQPLLETRYRMARMKPPFGRMEHLDLLFGARRLWKLRFDSCRLVDLENQILGFEREGDLPGEMIPYVYFEYLRKREAGTDRADPPSQRHRYSDARLPDRDCAASVPIARRCAAHAWRGNGRPGALALPVRAIRQGADPISAALSTRACGTS